ncbi:mechanosensitive ion channel family protein [Clostridia bacterium OttesenSCG-928-F22]|nr:mechanosensitive ion channel family protein [Clostridia bacterium OttesenSCG-928-F22]
MEFFETAINSIVEWINSLGTMAPGIISAIIKIILILIAAKLAIVFGKKLLRKILFPKTKTRFVKVKKGETIYSLMKSVLKYVVYFAAIVAILYVVGLGAAATSLLGAVGIGGLAISFGAQTLVKDIVNGFFFLFEDQFSVGDHVELAGIAGLVESVAIRTTTVRALSGERYTIPNHSITVVKNFSRGSILAVADIEVAYETDLEKAYASMQRAATLFCENNEDVVEEPSVVGLTSLGQSGVVLRMACQVKPLTGVKAQRAMLRHMKDCFEQDGIEIPYPHVVVLPKGSAADGI